MAAGTMRNNAATRHKSFLVLFFKKERLSFLLFQWVALPG
jgi:hypothetical protein